LGEACPKRCPLGGNGGRQGWRPCGRSDVSCGHRCDLREGSSPSLCQQPPSTGITRGWRGSAQPGAWPRRADPRYGAFDRIAGVSATDTKSPSRRPGLILAGRHCKTRQDDASQRELSWQASRQMPRSLARAALSTDVHGLRPAPARPCARWRLSRMGHGGTAVGGSSAVVAVAVA
jgi:hypothetical protein